MFSRESGELAARASADALMLARWRLQAQSWPSLGRR